MSETRNGFIDDFRILLGKDAIHALLAGKAAVIPLPPKGRSMRVITYKAGNFNEDRETFKLNDVRLDKPPVNRR